MDPLKAPLKCVECGKEFKKVACFHLHVRTHTGEKPYKCFYCDRAFSRKHHVKRHMNGHTNNTLLLFTCNVEGCNKKFKLERRYKRHCDRAHGTPYKCTFDGCELEFNKKFKMKKHRATHDDPRVHKCPVEGCTWSFAVKRVFDNHVKRHDKEYKCRILGCDVVVKSWSEYRKHIKSHEKIHCKECDVVCPNKSTFQQHCREAHPVPKQTKFDCPYHGCSKTYGRGSNLNSHIRTAHDGQRFHCEVEGCGRKFRHNATLKNHLASHETATKKTKKKRKRKSLAAKLARYNGELCDLPVTYVKPDGSKVLAAVTVVGEAPARVSQECDVSTDSSSNKEVQEERQSSELDSGDDNILSSCSESVPNILMERLQAVIKDSHMRDVNELCSTESNSEAQNNLSRGHAQLLECSASS